MESALKMHNFKKEVIPDFTAEHSNLQKAVAGRMPVSKNTPKATITIQASKSSLCIERQRVKSMYVALSPSFTQPSVEPRSKQE